MAEHNQVGKDGETTAIEYLKTKGYQILHTNWRKGRYELDIVAKTSDELIIVEVKTRLGIPLEMPELAVDKQKINRIVFAADLYVKMFDIDLPARFDIISIIGYPPNYIIEHFEDAFYPPVKTYS